MASFTPGTHPQRMPEDTPVFLVGKRITAILVLLGQQVEKSGNIPFVDEAAILVHAEELAEIDATSSSANSLSKRPRS